MTPSVEPVVARTPGDLDPTRPEVPGGERRLGWLDTARGLAIVLVVVFHGVQDAVDAGFRHQAWDDFAGALATFRMPLFFFVSGLLAAGVLGRSWRELTVRRLAVYLWLYAAWWTLMFAVKAVLPAPADAPVYDLTLWSRGFAMPSNEIWYLWALALFVTVARVGRSVPTWAVLSGAAVVAVVVGSSWVPTPAWVAESMAMYAVFFFLGTRVSRPVLRRTRGRAPRGPLVAVVVAAYGLCTGLLAVHDSLRLPFVSLTVSVVGVAVGVLLSIWLARQGWARGLATVGRLTLPVYVLHQLVMAVAVLALAPLVGTPWHGVTTALAPLVLAVVALVGSLVVHAVLRPVPGVFAPPAWVVRTVDAAFARAAAR